VVFRPLRSAAKVQSIHHPQGFAPDLETEPMKAATTWILVADGGQAFVMERTAATSPLKRITNLEFKGPRKKSSDIGTDRPGRVFRGAKSVRRAAVGDDKKLARDAEEKFLGSVLDRLEGALKDGAFKQLILAAPPRVLGALRKQLPPSLAKTLKGEIRADLVNAEVDEIAEHIADMRRG
jgi:protein required for attachment to host cells